MFQEHVLEYFVLEHVMDHFVLEQDNMCSPGNTCCPVPFSLSLQDCPPPYIVIFGERYSCQEDVSCQKEKMLEESQRHRKKRDGRR